MTHYRQWLNAAVLAAFWLLAMNASAHAQFASRAQQLAAQQRFLNLVRLYEAQGKPLTSIPLDPRLVAQFDRNYSRAQKKYGSVLPPLLVPNNGYYPSTYTFNQIFRQNFGFVLLTDRATAKPGGGAALILAQSGYSLGGSSGGAGKPSPPPPSNGSLGPPPKPTVKDEGHDVTVTDTIYQSIDKYVVHVALKPFEVTHHEAGPFATLLEASQDVSSFQQFWQSAIKVSASVSDGWRMTPQSDTIRPGVRVESGSDAVFEIKTPTAAYPATGWYAPSFAIRVTGGTSFMEVRIPPFHK